MIETYAPPLIAGADTGCPVPALFSWRVYVECGCAVYVGLRVDDREPLCVANPCCPDHREHMEAFNDAMADSLGNPTELPLTTVVEMLLEHVHPAAGASR